MKNLVSNFINDESGATAIEYGLIIAVMAVVITAAFNTLGGGLKTGFGEVAKDLK